jgi:hydrogenase expression/formation protein HypC
MCLAIPGQIVEIIDAENFIAKVEVGGVRRGVNIGMLDDVKIGDWVLVHVGFAMSKIDEKQAEETLQTLRELGAYEDEFQQFQTSIN